MTFHKTSTLLKNYFKNKHVSNIQLESFNHLINEGLQKVIDNEPALNVLIINWIKDDLILIKHLIT